MNMKDLTIPRQQYLEDLMQSEEPKHFRGVEMQSSVNSLYIKNNSSNQC